MKKLLLALALLWPLGAFAQTIGNLSGGSGGGGGGAVSSVSGTSGQVTCSPTTGSVICGLPSTITEALTFSGAIDTAAGSASTPGLAVGNSTTGFYSVSTTGFGVSVNGTNKLDYGVTNVNLWTSAVGFVTSAAIGASTFQAFTSGSSGNRTVLLAVNGGAGIGGLALLNGGAVGWGGTTDSNFGVSDTLLFRSSAGVLEVSTSSTPNSSGSLLLTNLTASGAVQGASYKVGSTAGASCAAGTLISSITVSNGIVTAITGTGC
jgi:hypothetical protein